MQESPSETTAPPSGEAPASVSKLLFDISAMDLNARVDGKPGIAKWVPHRGTMAFLDHVVWHDRDSALAAADALPRDADLSAVLKAIDETSVSFGHYVAEGATAR